MLLSQWCGQITKTELAISPIYLWYYHGCVFYKQIRLIKVLYLVIYYLHCFSCIMCSLLTKPAFSITASCTYSQLKNWYCLISVRDCLQGRIALISFLIFCTFEMFLLYVIIFKTLVNTEIKLLTNCHLLFGLICHKEKSIQ